METRIPSSALRSRADLSMWMLGDNVLFQRLVLIKSCAFRSEDTLLYRMLSMDVQKPSQESFSWNVP